jgi:hypothetical protein
MVGAVGFEPTTLWSQTRCADQTALRSETYKKQRLNRDYTINQSDISLINQCLFIWIFGNFFVSILSRIVVNINLIGVVVYRFKYYRQPLVLLINLTNRDQNRD